jgi:hypothetical protein
MSKIRLVKVLVQPVFLIDHGDSIEEVEHPAVAIPASEWPTYSSERFPAEVEAWQAQLDAEAPKPPNREMRRAKPPKS